VKAFECCASGVVGHTNRTPHESVMGNFTEDSKLFFRQPNPRSLTRPGNLTLVGLLSPRAVLYHFDMAPRPDESQNLALELQDGYVCFGRSFGAEKSIAGELVFQTGMVGYPESITDPSYRGQILVITFPLVGNYGVPSREAMDSLLKGIPAHFESSEIHIAGLVVAAYAEEEFSHHLATSSLGTWLKEQGVPAITGVDTRALTKRIREEGSMLGRLLQRTRPSPSSTALTNGTVNTQTLTDGEIDDWRSNFDRLEWSDPNEKNLVAEGNGTCGIPRMFCLTPMQSQLRSQSSGPQTPRPPSSIPLVARCA
jgi:hypothetical protein